MIVELGLIGRELHDAQEADAAKRTGAMASALTYRVDAEQLRLRVGLLSRQARAKRSRGRDSFYGAFYAPFIEFGVAAQTVLVTRRIKSRVKRGLGKGKGTRTTYITPKRRRRYHKKSPNYGTFVGDPYKLRVKPRPAHPFVAQPLLMQVADNHLSEFWQNAIARLGRPS
ncbi:hypothetical protein [Sphingomonas aquatilis]|uniref:hypothetical protein n=1 Tax=Sphingomonas aquatilis TaxID=93063 RepID=UPI0023F7D047|nr:hypothetical protein [Sphingomonas aquatilis]MCI4653123.1 hypothetical protein [Sphingomonas aquatilis]